MQLPFDIHLINERKKKVSSSGYVLVYLPEHKNHKSGWVFEHRAIIEAILDRYLERHEVVHHIDHDKVNNAIHNLQLTDAIEHGKLHNKHYHLRPLIFDLYERGFSVRQIARKLNIGKSTVQKYTQEANIIKNSKKA